jgi:porin
MRRLAAEGRTGGASPHPRTRSRWHEWPLGRSAVAWSGNEDILPAIDEDVSDSRNRPDKATIHQAWRGVRGPGPLAISSAHPPVVAADPSQTVPGRGALPSCPYHDRPPTSAPRRPLEASVAVGLLLLVVFSGGAAALAETPPVTMAEDSIDEARAPGPALTEAQDESGPAQEATGSERAGAPFESITGPLTRNWERFRAFLTGLGIASTARYTAQLMGNPSGGRNQGFTYAGSLEASIAWDLDKLLGVPGFSFNVSANWATGQNLSAQDIGNVFAVQNAFYGTGSVNLQQLYLQQEFLDASLTVAAGRLAPANMFATMPVLNNYMNGAINAEPGSLPINVPPFVASPPGVEWGAQAKYNVTSAFRVAAGVYNTNPAAAAGADHGVNFSLGEQGNRGVLSVAQVDYLLNQAQGDAGVPGQYSLGGFYDSDTFSNLSEPDGTVSGNYGVYAMFQQMVYRDGGPASQRGLTVWGEVVISPKQSATTIPYFLAGGVSYQGLIPSREKDIASLGVVHGIVSRYIPGRSAETVIEANYQIRLTSWLAGSPDVQYIIRPSGSSAIRNAVVVGAQIMVTF